MGGKVFEIPDKLVIAIVSRVRVRERRESEKTGEQGETQAGGFHAAI